MSEEERIWRRFVVICQRKKESGVWNVWSVPRE